MSTFPQARDMGLAGYEIHRREYQRLFELHSVHFGDPEDLALFMEKLDSDKGLAIDFWSLSRSIARRQKGTLSQEGQLSIIASAIVGPETPALDPVSHRLLDDLAERLSTRIGSSPIPPHQSANEMEPEQGQASAVPKLAQGPGWYTPAPDPLPVQATEQPQGRPWTAHEPARDMPSTELAHSQPFHEQGLQSHEPDGAEAGEAGGQAEPVLSAPQSSHSAAYKYISIPPREEDALPDMEYVRVGPPATGASRQVAMPDLLQLEASAASGANPDHAEYDEIEPFTPQASESDRHPPLVSASAEAPFRATHTASTVPRVSTIPVPSDDEPPLPSAIFTRSTLAYTGLLLLCILLSLGLILHRNAATTGATHESMSGSWSPRSAPGRAVKSFVMTITGAKKPSPAVLPPRNNAQSDQRSATPSRSYSTPNTSSLQGSGFSATGPANPAVNSPDPTSQTANPTSNNAEQASSPAPTRHGSLTLGGSGQRTVNFTNKAGRISVSSGVMAANLIGYRPPDYPRLASIAHVQGPVVLQAIITRRGMVDHVHVIKGHYLLRKSAADAVRRWRYRPYLLNGEPVEVATIVTVDFTLRK